jgi:DNA-binding Lrp family transcriptional regulator
LRDLDDELVTMLRHDGRASYAELAVRLHVPRALVASRVRALLDDGTIRVTASVHPELLGQHAIGHVSIHIDGPADHVIDALISDPAVVLATAVAGSFDVLAEIRTETNRELYERVGAIRALASVTRVETLQYVDVQFGILIPTRPSPGTRLDQVDRRAIDLLSLDGRISYADLGRELGISGPAARKRVVRLLDDGVLRIGATQARRSRSGPVAAGIGLNTNAQDVGPTIERLRRTGGIEFVATTLGRYDIVATLGVAAESTLAERLNRLRGMRGVTRLESWVHLQVFKERYEVSAAS